MIHIETSALDSSNVENAFNTIVNSKYHNIHNLFYSNIQTNNFSKLYVSLMISKC